MGEPIYVRCYNDCYWIRDDSGDYYTPPSSECGKDYKEFEDLNIEPCYGERDEEVCPDCPFYLNYDMIAHMESEYHFGEPFTNGDELRAMSNEELVSTFTGLWRGNPVFACPRLLQANIESACPYPQMMCSECFLDWLQSPAEGGNHDT